MTLYLVDKYVKINWFKRVDNLYVDIGTQDILERNGLPDLWVLTFPHK